MVQLRPNERQTRIRNFSWLLMGLFLSGSVHLSKIANKAPATDATLPSLVRRLSRLLGNASIRVREWYGPLARRLLECQAQKLGGEIRLEVDGSKVGAFEHRLLVVGLAYRRRVLPLAWSWVRSEKGHSSSYKQRALLGYVNRLMPGEARRVSVVGDSEFGSIETLKQLEGWGWYYVMRQRSHLLVRSQQQPQQWRPLGEFIERAGEEVWLEDALLSRLHAHRTNLVLYWKSGEKELWLLATNLPTVRQSLGCYRRRMWIEGMFADFKRHGFDLESTQSYAASGNSGG